MKERKRFSLSEARELLPWLSEAAREAERALQRTRKSPGDPIASQREVARIIHHWAETVVKLGALPKQPFTVDFDSGTDYFCWEYPEEDIFYRHGYDRGYAGRHRIEGEETT